MAEVIITTNLVQTVNIELTAITGGVLPDGIVENTDETYSDTVANGSTLVIPDINITKNDDSVVQSPAAIDIDLRIIDPATAPSGWDEQVAEYGRGYTFGEWGGETTIYRTGDAASIEQTVLGALRSADELKMINQIDPSDFTKVANTNSFGNLNLWTDEDGLQVYGNDVIVNHITGLSYIGTSKAGAGSWEDNIDTALGATDASHSDWFMASLNQIYSIIDKNTLDSRCLFGGQPSMFSIGAPNLSASTTGLFEVTMFYFNAFNVPVQQIAKTNDYLYLLCRPHF